MDKVDCVGDGDSFILDTADFDAKKCHCTQLH